MPVKILLALSLIFVSQNCFQKKKCKLIILITIDGLRGDLLEKYRPAFKHGFKSLFEDGFEFKNAWVDHAITVSHAGHVTLATGNYPKTHGIVDAAYYQKTNDSLVFTEAFADSNYSIIGYPGTKSISAKNVLTPGLAEWVRNNNPNNKILCVGTGNISSALYCFHPNEDVFWYSEQYGRYVSSTYFLPEEPNWVKEFNIERLPVFFKMSVVWKNIVPQEFLALCNKDNTEFENYGGHHVFPYLAPEKVEKENLYNQWILNTPFLDNATLSLAESGIESLRMGAGTTTDYLAIVLSQVDNTCHSFGPSSLETLNVLMQLDIALGDFFLFLDQKIGRENFVVALSADHGFAEIPEQTLAKGKWAKRLNEETIEKIMNRVNLIKRQYPNHKLRLSAIKNFLLGQDFIADVYSPAQLNDPNASGDRFLELSKKSCNQNRVPRLPFFSLRSFRSEIANEGLMVRLKENAMIDLDCVIHGSPYKYDRSVPLFFFGGGIKKGYSFQEVHTIDLAPTLAGLANLKISNTVDGRSLLLTK